MRNRNKLISLEHLKEQVNMRIDGILRAKGDEVIAVAPHATVLDAAQLLHKHRIGALLVMDRTDQLVGIVSERDIVAAISELRNEALNMPVARVMSGEVVVCSPRDTVEHLMTVMTERRFRHLPVVDNGKIVGIVSIGDVVKRRISEISDEADVLHDYLTHGR
jgi:CBS domain-containing protein